jgi:hypothetical protein
MKVNIIIRIEDCEDPEQHLSVAYEGSDTDAALASNDSKIVQSVVKLYLETFGE